MKFKQNNWFCEETVMRIKYENHLATFVDNEPTFLINNNEKWDPIDQVSMIFDSLRSNSRICKTISWFTFHLPSNEDITFKNVPKWLFSFVFIEIWNLNFLFLIWGNKNKSRRRVVCNKRICHVRYPTIRYNLFEWNSIGYDFRQNLILDIVFYL